MTDDEIQKDANDEKPRARSSRHKVGWIPHTGARRDQRKIAVQIRKASLRPGDADDLADLELVAVFPNSRPGDGLRNTN